MNRSRGLLLSLACLPCLGPGLAPSLAQAGAPPTGSPAQASMFVAPAPADPLPPDAGPDTGPDPAAPVEGPTEPEVAEFEDPIVDALQPVPGGLTSEEVARRSVEASPMLAVKQTEIDVAKAQLNQTLYQFIPRVEASATYLRMSQARLNFDFDLGIDYAALADLFAMLGQDSPITPPEGGIEDPPLNAFTLQAQIGVPISDYIARLPTAKKAGQAQVRAAEYAATAERLTTQKDARLAYYDWVRAIASKVALQESLVRTQARLLDAEAAFEAGVASKADVMRLDAAVATLTAATIRTENFQLLAEQALSLQMGSEEFASYSIGEDLFKPRPPLADADDLKRMIQEAEDQRYEMRAFAASTEALDYGIKTTRAGYYPRLDGFAEATYANPNQRFFPLEPVFNGSWSAGLTLSFVVNDAINTSAKMKELQANERALEAQREMLRRGLALEVAAAHAERQSVLAELQYIQRATESATEGYRVAVDLYQVGDATTTDILDAEYERVDATLRNINAKIDLRIADFKLMYALGRLEPIAASE